MKESEKKGAKMNWKNRLTNYNFWISIFSAVLLILQALKIEFDFVYVNEIFTAVLGLLVVIGIISDPTRTSVKITETTKTEELTVKEETEKEKVETLPTDEKNEVDYVFNQNDFQTLINKIAVDLDEKIAILSEKFNDLKNFNQETLTKIIQTKENGLLSEENNNKENKGIESPAVAEMTNPYIDVII